MGPDTCLQRDHAQRMPEHIMELLRDPQPLVGNRMPGLLRARLLRQLRPFLEQDDVLPADVGTAPQGERPGNSAALVTTPAIPMVVGATTATTTITPIA